MAFSMQIFNMKGPYVYPISLSSYEMTRKIIKITIFSLNLWTK